MKRLWMAAALVGAGITVSSCGFTPLYSDKPTASGLSAQSEMEAIKLDTPDGRLQQFLYRSLSDELRTTLTTVDPKYHLKIKLTTEVNRLAFEQDSFETRYNLEIRADFRLLDIGSETELFKGETRAIAAYNRTDSQYAAIVAQEDAEKSAAQVLSENIAVRLAAYFRTRS